MKSMDDFIESEKLHWYYANGSQINGPISLSELQSLLGSGTLSTEALIWQPSFKDWTSARSVDALLVKSLSVSEDMWLYTNSGEECGPVPKSKIRHLIQENKLKQGEQIRKVNNTVWIPVEKIIDDSRKQPPPLPIQGVTVFSKNSKINLPYAGLKKRALAFLIDLAILIATKKILLSLSLPVHNIFIGMLYFSVMEASNWQATVGKRVLKLAVTREDGSRISFSQAVIRYYAKYVSAFLLGVGFLMTAMTERKQGLHDMIASTYVLEARQ